ncbi:MAG: hypothetical protein KDD44_11600, partial [Bdellovibrionales bacterium]|nr:hypothetical protein [Bdellovibrionales bacterium]
MSDASAAGTLIVAVMETAGYITQERILDSFGGFFNSAGAFLYTIGCIGGLISVALFGSFRAARYLLIGPTLYWFVIGPRADIPGAMWKLGDGQPRNHQGVVTEEEAVLTSRRASAEPKDENEYIRVSYFFYLYSHVINGVVHDFVSAILEHEDDEDLLFVARTQAIENLYRTEVGEGQLWQMLRDNYYGSCEKMLSAEYGKSSPELSDAHLQDMTLRRSSVPANSEEWNLYNHQVEQITARRAFYADLSAKAALIEVKPNQATLRYIQENMLAAQRPGINYLFRGGRDPELDPQEFQNEKFGYNITCGELWQIIADAARDEARSLWEKEYQKSGLTGQYSEQQFCSEIAKKMERSASPCDLTSTISMWLLRSAILKLNDQGDVQGFVNNMQFRKRIRRETFQIIDKDGQSNVSFDEANPVLRMNSSGDLEMQVYQLNDAGELDRDKLGNITSEKKWMPYFVVKQTAENEFGAAF